MNKHLIVLLISLITLACGDDKNNNKGEDENNSSSQKEQIANAELTLENKIKNCKSINLKSEKMVAMKYTKLESGEYDLENPYWEDKSGPLDGEINLTKMKVWRNEFAHVNVEPNPSYLDTLVDLPYYISNIISGENRVVIQGRSQDSGVNIDDVDVVVTHADGSYQFVSIIYGLSGPRYLISGKSSFLGLAE